MNTFIYSIEHIETHEIYYVGSCTRIYFCQRRGDHTKIKEHNQDIYNRAVLPVHRKIFEAGGWGCFEFKILHSCDKLEKFERLKLEQEYIELYKPLYNVLSANLSVDRRRETKRLNLIKFRSNHPDYYRKFEDTPARIEYVKTRCNTKVDCPCGGKYHLQNKTNHCKTSRHQSYLATINTDS